MNHATIKRLDSSGVFILNSGMRLIDRHVLATWLKSFGGGCAITIGLLLLERMYDTLPDLLGFGATYWQILTYYLMIIPGFLPVILPLAILVSILFSVGSLRKNNEITAMRAGGCSIWEITRTLWLGGVVLSVLLFYLSAQVIPRSVERSREIWDNLAYNRALETTSSDNVGLIYNLTFYNTKANRLWFINRFSAYTTMAYGVTVSEMDDKGRELRRVIANQAYYDEYQGHWVLEDGRTITFDPATADPIRSQPFAKIEMENYTEDPTLMQALEKKPNSLSLKELHTLITELPAKNDPKVRGYLVQYHSLLAAPLSCLLVVGIALPFAMGGNSRNPMVGASQSVVFFFVYFIVARVLSLMGSRGVIDPILSAWIPSILTAVAVPMLFRYKRG
jgi:lipopolysaccharide export system permease protein